MSDAANGEESSTPVVVEEGDTPVAVDGKAGSDVEALPPAQETPAPNDEAAEEAVKFMDSYDEHGKDVLFTDGSEVQGRSRHKKEADTLPKTDESLAEATQKITNNDAWDASPARPEPARTTTLPPPREPAGWNRSVPMQNMSPPPAQFASQYLPSQQAPNIHVSPIRRSPPRYYGSMYTYTSPTASRYSTLLHEGGQGKSEGAGQSDVEAYQEQRLISQELAKLRAEVTALKEEVTRQKTKRREVKAQLHASKQKQLEIETEAKKAHTDDRAIRRELSKMKDIASERRSQIDALQEKASTSQAELREVQSKVWGLEKETATQKRVATNAQHKLETVQKRLEEVRTENQKLSKENELLLDERDEYKNQSEMFQHELERAGTLEAEMRKEAEVQREKVTRLTVEAETLESSISNSSLGPKEDGGRSSSLGEMAVLLDEQRCELELTKQRLEEEEVRSQSRKEKASVSKGKLEQVRSELAVAERERQALLAREASSAHYIKQIERDLANFEHQCAVMNDAVMTCQSREESHVREVNRLRTEADKAHQECEQYKEKMNMAEMKAANAESSRAMAERQYDAERERLQKMTEKNERVEQQLSELHEKYQTHALTEARLKERNEIVSENLKQKQFEVDTKQRQLDMAMQTVERLQVELRQAALLATGSTAPPPTMPALAAKEAPAAPEAQPRPASSGFDKTPEEKAPVLPQKKRINSSATANMKKALMAKKKMEQAKRSSTPNTDGDGRGGGTASLAAMKAKLRTELTKQVQDAENRKTKKKDMDFLGLGYESKKSKKRAPSSHASSSADEGDDL